ncbi:serine hydrolase [Thiocystis violacea]|uniref:serine hydrolase n=1 Tax=Thiocystis violacea TaxID=13725 RepID=UPI0019050A04|nr:serine hydrolase [Thiocystis violacea]MBK1717156.1 peptidase S11 [Thiocystis violacea]
MSRSPASSFLSRIQWGSEACRLTRLALVLLLVGPIVLTGAACAGSQEGPTSNQGQAAPDLHRPKPYVHATAPPQGSAYDWARLEQDAADWPPGDRSGSVWKDLDRSALRLNSASALIMDSRGNQLYAKNPRQVKSIASITKLMTAMVVLDTGVSLNTPIRIVEQDRDRLKNSRSRLRIGDATLSRQDMIMVAVMSSDNRAAHALGRTTYRGGMPEFVQAMNRKAQALGMNNTRFVDSSGLDPRNRSTAEDLVKMVRAASNYSLIRATTERGEMTLNPHSDHVPLHYRNTNPLVRSPEWAVDVSKTGFINEAGRCLVMQARIDNQPLYMVFLDSNGKLSTVGDSNRVRDWIMASHRTASR